VLAWNPQIRQTKANRQVSDVTRNTRLPRQQVQQGLHIATIGKDNPIVHLFEELIDLERNEVQTLSPENNQEPLSWLSRLQVWNVVNCLQALVQSKILKDFPPLLSMPHVGDVESSIPDVFEPGKLGFKLLRDCMQTRTTVL
jgi:hypothetical protein